MDAVDRDGPLARSLTLGSWNAMVVLWLLDRMLDTGAATAAALHLG
jgi:hypothetical protein